MAGPSTLLAALLLIAPGVQCAYEEYAERYAPRLRFDREMASTAQLLLLTSLPTALLGPVQALTSLTETASPDSRLTRTCGEQTNYQDTTFTNPTYPAAEMDGTGMCELTVIPMNNDICQVRLNFVEFTLAQPSPEGQCLTDFMVVTGSSSNVPQICGDNTGQHMYIDVEPNSTCNIKINIDTSTAGALWNIKVTQIACTSTNRAPNGCLQYFTETSGVVSSFNFASSTTPPTQTRQLADQHYGVCIQSRSGYCGVTWNTPGGAYDFSMTGAPGSTPPTTPGISEVGDLCTTDYVIIPGGEYVDLTAMGSADRFCGTAFPTTVTSMVTPYVLYVVTDSAELTPSGDLSNQGFSLKYRVNACSLTG